MLVDKKYFDAWMAAIDEMRRPDWKAVWDETSRDIAAGRGRSLDEVAKELGLDGPKVERVSGRDPEPRG